MTERNTGLSRRTMLASLSGTTGFFGFSGGVATMLSPRVSHNQWTLAQSQDDTLDLVVEWKEWYNGEVVEPTDSTPERGGEPVVTLENVMPGDSGRLHFALWTETSGLGGPDLAHLEMEIVAPAGAFAENGIVAAEKRVDSTPQQGELGEFVRTSVWYDSGGVLGPIDACNGTKEAGERFLEGNDGQPIDDLPLEGVVSPPRLGEWVDLDAEPGSEETAECIQTGAQNALCLGVQWALPEDLPEIDDNIVQSDSAEFEIHFRAISCGSNP